MINTRRLSSDACSGSDFCAGVAGTARAADDRFPAAHGGSVGHQGGPPRPAGLQRVCNPDFRSLTGSRRGVPGPAVVHHTGGGVSTLVPAHHLPCCGASLCRLHRIALWGFRSHRRSRHGNAPHGWRCTSKSLGQCPANRDGRRFVAFGFGPCGDRATNEAFGHQTCLTALTTRPRPRDVIERARRPHMHARRHPCALCGDAGGGGLTNRGYSIMSTAGSCRRTSSHTCPSRLYLASCRSWMFSSRRRALVMDALAGCIHARSCATPGSVFSTPSAHRACCGLAGSLGR